MPLLRGLFFTLTLLLLTACSTQYEVTKGESDKIVSLARDNRHFYVLGSHHDYQFPRQYTAALERLVQSPYAGKMSYIEASGRIYNKTAVSGAITLYISPHNLSQEQQKELVEQYGFRYISEVDKNSALWKKPELAAALAQTPAMLRGDYRLREGQVITIQNRQRLVTNYPLSQPINIDIDTLNTRHSYSSDAATVMTAPVMIVAAIPVYLIWGAMCSSQGC